MGWAKDLFGQKLVYKTSEKDTEEALQGRRHVVLFFMASW